MKISVDHSHRYSYAVVKLQNVTPIGADLLPSIYLMRHTLTPLSKLEKKYFTPGAYHCYLNYSKDFVERGQRVDSRVKLM